MDIDASFFFHAQSEMEEDDYEADWEMAASAATMIWLGAKEARIQQASYKDVPIVQGDAFMASAYVRQGLMPSTPLHPTVVVTVRALELFRVMRLRCPRLSVQAFTRGLCDLHSVAPHPYLGSQFSTTFDPPPFSGIRYRFMTSGLCS
ncbi:hypothetical protein B0H14DRAFT_3446975 [Mycena olivaceomarginata]|nr:hypothetical protein B0H14DRAFT_3446975 [Mycena olivaceomarginata]